VKHLAVGRQVDRARYFNDLFDVLVDDAARRFEHGNGAAVHQGLDVAARQRQIHLVNRHLPVSSAPANAARTHTRALSKSVTSPLRTPVDGCSPFPLMTMWPSSRISPTKATTFEVPISSATTAAIARGGFLRAGRPQAIWTTHVHKKSASWRTLLVQRNRLILLRRNILLAEREINRGQTPTRSSAERSAVQAAPVSSPNSSGPKVPVPMPSHARRTARPRPASHPGSLSVHINGRDLDLVSEMRAVADIQYLNGIHRRLIHLGAHTQSAAGIAVMTGNPRAFDRRLNTQPWLSTPQPPHRPTRAIVVRSDTSMAMVPGKIR